MNSLIISAYAEALMRLELAAEAMGVTVTDIDPKHFPASAQARWRAAADDRIRALINDRDPMAGNSATDSHPRHLLLETIRNRTHPAARPA